MIIKSIKLTNFRNHTSFLLKCKDETTLILGNNGFGKTSVLEAIYILTQGKSFRATDPDIIKHGTNFYRVELEYQNGEKVAATFNGKTKTFHILDQKFKRLPKKHKYPIVLFLPSDLNLISHAPGRRRDYFDRIYSEFDDNYNSSLSKYEKALKQRNELLKNESVKKEDVFIWNLVLAKYGTKISTLRDTFTKELNDQITKTYRSISKNEDQIDLIYQTELSTKTEAFYLDNLEKSFQKDTILGHTTFGIHHDDYIFNFNSNLANSSASRGETRSIILALKFIEANLIFQKQNLRPIILLDDVFSELDSIHRESLTYNFKDNQVIITSVESI